MANVDTNTLTLEERQGTSSFRIGSKSLNFILNKNNKGMQRAVLLEMGQEDLPSGRLKVQTMLDYTLLFS